jgi:DNA repair protein RadC
MQVAERVRIQLVREKVEDPHGVYTRVVGPNCIARMAHHLISDEPVEVVIVLHLNARNRVTHFEEIGRGTADAAIVVPRDVFRSAVASNARSIIVAHNHPSGDATPSEEDIKITDTLKKSGKLLGIPLLDHLVIGESSWVSALDPTLRGPIQL